MAVKRTMFTKRTDDPKLAWLECLLLKAGIPSRRSGYSFHAPVLEVPEEYLDAAWAILTPVDDVEDDDPRWTDPSECPPEMSIRLRGGAERAEAEHFARLSTRLSGVKGGKHRGKMGALLCETKDGVRFKIGTGFTDADRAHPPKIGDVVTFTYQELSKNGLPRFPAFLRVRRPEPGGRRVVFRRAKKSHGRPSKRWVRGRR